MYFKNFEGIDLIVKNMPERWMDVQQGMVDCARLLESIGDVNPPYDLINQRNYEQPFNEATKIFYRLGVNVKHKFLWDVKLMVEATELGGQTRQVMQQDMLSDLDVRIRSVKNYILVNQLVVVDRNSAVLPDAVASRKQIDEYCSKLILDILIDLRIEIEFRFPVRIPGLFNRHDLPQGTYPLLNEPGNAMYLLPAGDHPNNGLHNPQFVQYPGLVEPASMTVRKSFVVIKGDLHPQIFRRPKGNLPDYVCLVKYPDELAEQEQILFDCGIINADYCFIKKKGNQYLLAAYYHQLIAQGHFNVRYIKKRRNFKICEIVKFLDHRYCANADKQFRNLNKDREKLNQIIGSRYWLDHMPRCIGR